MGWESVHCHYGKLRAGGLEVNAENVPSPRFLSFVHQQQKNVGILSIGKDVVPKAKGSHSAKVVMVEKVRESKLVSTFAIDKKSRY